MDLTERPCFSPLASPLGTRVRNLQLRSDKGGDGAHLARRRGKDGAHQAVDIAAPLGTAVHSVDEGRVLGMCTGAKCGAGGQSVTLGHYNSEGELVSTSYYAHLAGVDGSLTVGATVDAGQKLGSVGQTGNAGGTNPHLHLQVKNAKTGVAVNMESTLSVQRAP